MKVSLSSSSSSMSQRDNNNNNSIQGELNRTELNNCHHQSMSEEQHVDENTATSTSNNNIQQQQVEETTEQKQQQQKTKTRQHVFHSTIRKPMFGALKSSIISTLLLMFTIAVLMSLIMGAEWSPVRYAAKVRVDIVNYDKELYGHLITNHLMHQKIFNWNLNEEVKREALDEFVAKGLCWIMVEIPPRLTERINQTIQNHVPYSNDPIRIFYDQGRHFQAASNVLVPLLNGALSLTSTYVLHHILNTTSHHKLDQDLIMRPVRVEYVNLHPVPYSGLNVATNLTYIIMFVLSMSVAGNIIAIWGPLNGKVSHWQYCLVRVVHSIVTTLLLTLILSLILLAFGAKFPRSFPAYWLFNWLVMFCFASINGFLMQLLGPIATIPILIFFVLNITSGSATVPHDMVHKFYYIGKGLPMYNAVNGARSLLFGSYSRIGLNIGVLLIYTFASIILTIIVIVLGLQQYVFKYTPKDIIKLAKQLACIGHTPEEAAKGAEEVNEEMHSEQHTGTETDATSKDIRPISSDDMELDEKQISIEIQQS
jgi:hypothetical protein